MKPALHSQAELLGQHVSVEVAEQKNHLKKQQADCPDCRDSTEPGKNDLCDQRFHLKQEKRAHENRQRIQEVRRVSPHLYPERRRRVESDYTYARTALYRFFCARSVGLPTVIHIAGPRWDRLASRAAPECSTRKALQRTARRRLRQM